MLSVREYYNILAFNYENLIESNSVNAVVMHNEIKKIFKKHNIKKGNILDIGCGPGNLKKYLGDNFFYTGVDFSKAMLTQAKNKGYKVIEGKIEDILTQIPDKSFDYILAISSLHFIKDIDSIITELERISIKGFCITLDRITNRYKRGFGKIIKDDIYNHFNLKIKDLDDDIKMIGWISPRDGEDIKVRVIFKGLKN